MEEASHKGHTKLSTSPVVLTHHARTPRAQPCTYTATQAALTFCHGAFLTAQDKYEPAAPRTLAPNASGRTGQLLMIQRKLNSLKINFEQNLSSKKVMAPL